MAYTVSTLLCIVIPKDWQVFLVMDLLPSADPLMGGSLQNMRREVEEWRSGPPRPCRAKSAHQYAYRGACVGLKTIYFSREFYKRAPIIKTTLMENCNQASFISAQRIYAFSPPNSQPQVGNSQTCLFHRSNILA